MNRTFVIFNPVARGEKSQRVRQFLQAKARENRSLTLAPTTGPGDAQQLAARAVADGAELVVAAGGDGTVNEIVNGLGTTGVALGVLPLGTANVFARELGLPLRLDAAWDVIERGATRDIDLGRAEANGVTRYFAQLAGVGLDAIAVERASWELKKKIGPLSYVWSGLQTLAQPPVAVEVSMNGSGVAGRGPAVLVGNGRFYGGPFPAFPQAKLDDGLLDVCVFENGGYLDALRYAQGVFRGVHTKFRDVRYFQTPEFTCAAVPAVPFELDGELAGRGTVRFSVVPRALRVMVPNTDGGNGHAR